MPDYDNSYSVKPHVIFIPVGAIIFFLTLCIRICCCRSKTVVQRFRTVTIIQRDPTNNPDEFVNVTVAPASPPVEDLPPSYAEIENELPPPVYSERYDASTHFAQSVPVTDTEIFDGESHSASTNCPTSTEAGTGQPRAAFARALKARLANAKSQFAFKKIENEE